MNFDSDRQMAFLLQKQFDLEYNVENPPINLSYEKGHKSQNKNRQPQASLTDPSWELVDPTPNIHILFVNFNERFFWNKLLAVAVSWSKRMTSCAGVCSYQGRGGLCSITLSEPLLKLRPRKDLIETLLHEMIHAYLFVTHNNRDRDGHGPEFHKHMYRINNEAGTNITVYHDFHDEVRLYKQHWWRCDGPCQKVPPYFGTVRRATNRAPGPYDRWWAEHQHKCGGKFIKVREPEKKIKTKSDTSKPSNAGDIRKYISSVSTSKVVNQQGNIRTANTITNSNFHSTKNRNGTIVVIDKTGKDNMASYSTNNITGFKNQISANSNKMPVEVFSGTGNTLNEKKNVNILHTSTERDYSTVRNHWLNKFYNTNQNLKREVEDTNSPTSKRNKVESINNISTVTCPNCDKNIPNNLINSHVDFCLNADTSIVSEFSDEMDNSSKFIECPSCGTMVDEEDINSHLDECLSTDSNKKATVVSNNMSNTITKKIEDTTIEYITCCCDKLIPSNEFNLHAQECLSKYYDQLEKKYESNVTEVATVLCLVCNKSVLKPDLNEHLEDCMVSVFDNDMPSSNNSEAILTKKNEYNCPICMLPVSEESMNDHVDACLKFNECIKTENY